MPSCAVKWCINRSHLHNKNVGISFHGFPQDQYQRELWTKAVRLERQESEWTPNKSTRICSVHFRINDDFYVTKKGYTKLKTNAIPICTIQLPPKDPQVPQLAVPNTKLSVSDIELQSERTDEESSERLPAEDDDEITVFCPKCDTEVLHSAKGIQKDQTKIIIAKVYHYFEQEYEELKNTYEGLELTPLSKFRQRTALATGVSESTVCEILQEEERRNAEEQHVQLRVPTKARKRSRQTDSSNEEDFESDDDGDDDEQPSTDHATETLVVKEEPLETFNEEPENSTELAVVKDEPGVPGANEELADPLVADVKTEPQNEESTNLNKTRTVQPTSKRYKGRIRARNEEASPGSSAPPGPSAPPRTSAPPGPSAPPSKSAPPTRKRELLLLEDGEVKLKDIEIGEEGFS